MRLLALPLGLAALATLAACGPDRLPEPTDAPDALVLEDQPVETDFDARPPRVDLSGTWRLSRDPAGDGEARGLHLPETDPGIGWEDQPVPGTWNVRADGTLDGYKGAAWLRTDFAIGSPGDRRVLLRFGACFLRCAFWLNGQPLAEVERPYLPILLDATAAALPGTNVLVVRADNRITDRTIPVDTIFNAGRHGWWPFGGLTRSVEVELAAPIRPFELVALPSPGPGEDSVTLRLGLVNAGDARGTVAALDLRLLAPDGAELAHWQTRRLDVPAGVSRIEASHALKAARWSPRTPEALYTAEVTLDGHTWRVRFGFRTVSTSSTRLLINDVPYTVYGASRHEDAFASGPAQSDAHLAADLEHLRALGANQLRPGHYAADERWLRMLRDAGILVFEELPIYQWSARQMADRALQAQALTLLRAMIQRDRNNPAIVAWSLMNEVHSWEPEATAFTRRLANEARALTPDRLTTYAMQAVPAAIFPKEYAAAEVDVIGINEYYLWYYGDLDGLRADLRRFRDANPDKPMIVTEFGAGGLLERSSGAPFGPEPMDDHTYAADWQAWYLTEHLNAFRELGFIGGAMPWAFADFRMEWNPPTGKPHPADQMNLKGLLTHDRRRKPAFDAVREAFVGGILD